MTDSWRTDEPQLDEDHERLTKIVASLSMVINGREDNLVIREVIEVLRERMRVHFHREEVMAGRIDAASRSTLQADHAALLSMLDDLALAAERRDAQIGRRLSIFREAAARHEAEVDMPLFLMRRPPASWN